MADVTKMTDTDLEAVAAEIAVRRVAREEERRAADREAVAFLTDVGIGSDKKATLADMVAALAANLDDVPRELFVHANAMLLGAQTLDGAIRAMSAPAVPTITPV